VLSGCKGSSRQAAVVQFALSARSATDADTHIEHLSFYVHDVVLHTADGGDVPLTFDHTDWQDGRVALIDMSGAAAGNDTVRGTLSQAHAAFTGVRFLVGVPFDLNHGDPLAAGAPLNRGEMFWAWQSGYKFLRVDLSDPRAPWSFHLGSTGCSSGSAIRPPTSPCAQPNVVTVELSGFDPTQHPIQVHIEPLTAAMRDSNPRACTGSYATDPACAAGYAATGLDVRTGQCPGGICSDQRLFGRP